MNIESYLKDFGIENTVILSECEKVTIPTTHRLEDTYQIKLPKDFKTYTKAAKLNSITHQLAMIKNAQTFNLNLLMQDLFDGTVQVDRRNLVVCSAIFTIRTIWASDLQEQRFGNIHKDFFDTIREFNNKAKRSKNLPPMSNQEFFYFALIFGKVERYYRKNIPSYNDVLKYLPTNVSKQLQKLVSFIIKVPKITTYNLEKQVDIKNLYKKLVVNLLKDVFNISVNIEILNKDTKHFWRI